MTITVVPIVMMVVGALTYAFSKNTKVTEVGRLILLAGLLAFAFANGGKVVTL